MSSKKSKKVNNNNYVPDIDDVSIDSSPEKVIIDKDTATSSEEDIKITKITPPPPKVSKVIPKVVNKKPIPKVVAKTTTLTFKSAAAPKKVKKREETIIIYPKNKPTDDSDNDSEETRAYNNRICEIVFIDENREREVRKRVKNPIDIMSDCDDELFYNIDLSIVIIGDIHFRSRYVQEGQEFIERCLKKVKELSPKIVIVLGDTLDTHEMSKESAYRLAYFFLEGLTSISYVYLLMGNHDMINHDQFQTDRHFFLPYKKWKNIDIVDTARKIDVDGHTFICCPYVPVGRFLEALCSIEGTSIDNTLVDVECVFAHQEIRGVNLSSESVVKSMSSDIWKKEWPPLVCGHIHDPQTIGSNVYYPGSSTQIAHNEKPDKRMWMMVFSDRLRPDITKYNLGIKSRKTYIMNCESIENFDVALLDRYYIKIKVEASREEYKLFKKSDLCATLEDSGIVFSHIPTLEEYKSLGLSERKIVTFDSILKELVNSKGDQCIKEAYMEMVTNNKKKENLTSTIDDELSENNE